MNPLFLLLLGGGAYWWWKSQKAPSYAGAVVNLDGVECSYDYPWQLAELTVSTRTPKNGPENGFRVYLSPATQVGQAFSLAGQRFSTRIGTLHKDATRGHNEWLGGHEPFHNTTTWALVDNDSYLRLMRGEIKELSVILVGPEPWVGSNSDSTFTKPCYQGLAVLRWMRSKGLDIRSLV